MKKLLIVATVVACFALPEAKAQTVNGVRLSDIKSAYIEVSTTEGFYNNKKYVLLEYGQKPTDGIYIEDDNGKRLEFNSALDAVNKMKNYGYELFQVYTIQKSGDTLPTYVLKLK